MLQQQGWKARASSSWNGDLLAFMVSMIIQGVTVTAIMTSTDIKIATENQVRPPAFSLMYDCIKIPGAEKMTASPIALLAEEQCGGAKGLVTAADGNGKTVCSKYK